MPDEYVAIVSIVVLFVLLFLRMPVAFVMLVVGITGMIYIDDVGRAFNVATRTVYGSFSDYNLIVIPLFVWMGFIAYHSGISAKIYDAANKFTGGLRGGLSMATIGACTAFGAICGSTTATAATMSAVALPEMNRYGYRRSFSTATIAAAAILGVMIPPSVIFILYGVSTGESIRQLFMAGVVPGVVLMVLFMVVAYLKILRDPSIAPSSQQVPFMEKVTSFFSGGMEVIFIFIIVMGLLFFDYISPTEAGAVGACATLVVALLRRTLSWKAFASSLDDAVRLSAMILFLTASAEVYGNFLSISTLPAAIAGLAAEAPLHPVLILAAILVVYLILGFFIDALALILMTTPIFAPVVSELGFDLVWFGVIVVLALGMGVITPPVGANVYVVAGVIRDIDVMEIFSGVWSYLLAIVICIALLIIFPEIALFLPEFIDSLAQ